MSGGKGGNVNWSHSSECLSVCAGLERQLGRVVSGDDSKVSYTAGHIAQMSGNCRS